MPGWTSTVPAISAAHPIVTRRIHRSAAAHCELSRTSSPVKAGMYVTGESPLGHITSRVDLRFRVQPGDEVR
jgi:hypothetical protein